jgi:hypothetical protein
MSERDNQIGFSQRIRLEWLERTANLVHAGTKREDLRAALTELLEEQLSVGGDAERGTREKVISILLKVWVGVPKELEGLRDAGLVLHRAMTKAERLPLHWGMCIAVYPFFGAVACHTGRLLTLQENAAATLVQRRVREHYGERETVSRAARRVLRSFIDWGVLTEGKGQGVYYQGAVQRIIDRELAIWLVEAYLHGGCGERSSLRSALEWPAFFPLQLPTLTPEQLLSSPRIEINRLGDNEAMLYCRK